MTTTNTSQPPDRQRLVTIRTITAYLLGVGTGALLVLGLLVGLVWLFLEAAQDGERELAESGR